MITKKGRRLLKLFRDEQNACGHIGCMCNTCIANMSMALRKLEEEEQWEAV